MRLVSCVLGCALVAGFTRADDKWVTVKGQVVFPDKTPIPKREELKVTTDKDHCTKNGPILDEAILVNPKNRGIKNVVVYLRPLDTKTTAFDKGQIHPDDAKRKPAEVVITQPCCLFVNRVTLARVGDTLVVKNPAPVAHNFYWSSQENGECNTTIPAGGKHAFDKPLVAEAGAIPFKCTIHPWMSGQVRVFDHPYYALTDENGNFEIKNAPAGMFRIVYWHEQVGIKTRGGEVINIQGPTLEMKPTDFDVTPKKN